MTATSTPPATFAAVQGVLAAQLPNYRRRPQQELLAAGIEATFEDGAPKHLLAQAGTGTGKSLGAMIPAILASRKGSGRRYVVATSTIALMTQYIQKDLPFLEKALGDAGIKFTWAPLKGLRNFLCLAKLNEQPDIEHYQDLIDEIAPNAEGEYTHTGDKDDVQTPVDQRKEWPLISSSSDECPGKKKCAMAERCFGLRHKAQAKEARIVVTNTAILMTDVKIHKQIRDTSDDGVGVHVLLDEYDGLIVDEAHELEDTATNHLGFDIKQGGIAKFLDQAVTFLNLHGGAEVGAQDQQDKILTKMDAIGSVIGKALGDEEKLVLDDTFITEHFATFENLYNDLDHITTAIRKTKIERGSKEKGSDTKERLATQGGNYLLHIKEVLGAEADKVVRWAEIDGRSGSGRPSGDSTAGARWIIKTAPIEVGDYLREELWSQVPAVLMSATLSTGAGADRFGYVRRALGLEDAAPLDVGTPFDYAKQAIVYVPHGSTPSPAARTRSEWETWVPEATLELVRIFGGGAMLLFTSRKAMDRSHALLAPRLQRDGINSFVQGGDLTNREIARRFRDDEDSVLFGLRSFMTGMDFPGNTCRLVVVDKLPFAMPSDPIVAAREEAIRKRGGQPFYDRSIPAMTLILEQAFGRLIRDIKDWGAVAIMDSRLHPSGSSWGTRIVRGLPPAPVTFDPADVKTFREAWKSAPGAAA
ncbi:ATP-dependent DNA helicase [Streptomyces albidoflavus]|uniref:ATP-dependent DNA helicase n=1 Tax=Streptomyces albidoflavus TaxID=1886 RepID=UPI0033C35566